MDPSDMQQFIAEHDVVAGPDRDALEALTAKKLQKCLLYLRKKYDRIRERVLEKRELKYVPTGCLFGWSSKASKRIGKILIT